MMAEPKHNTESDIPELRDARVKPEGVVPKQSQAYVVVGLATVILLAVLFSNKHVKPTPPAASPSWSLPTSTESNERAIQQLQRDLTEQQRQSQLKQAQTANAASAGTDKQNATNANTAGDAPRDPVADAERALRFKSRFASNLVEGGDVAQHASSAEKMLAQTSSDATESVTPPNLPMPQHDQVQQSGELPNKRPAEINLNSAIGQPYALFEGTTIDTVLVNRLNGDFSGPIKAMVTNPVYSQDRQHVLIPEGAFILGEIKKVSNLGQRRLAVVFHRIIMPDGYSVDLDQFHGLDAAGETGLTDKVNHHYIQIFGASIALGVIAGAAEATTNTGLVESGSDSLRQGVASSLAQSGAHVLDRFLNVLPEITVREGHRIKVYLTQDMLLPAYENHDMPGVM
jgi:type IV secretory pathway VirB10-like protein